jgi:hypothetical protein
MPRFLVAIHHADNYDPALLEDAAMHHDIDVLNDEMVAAGIRVFVGGLHSVQKAKSIEAVGVKTLVTDGPYLKTNAHVGGFWVLEVANLEQAVEWGRKAAVACRAAVEVREFH